MEIQKIFADPIFEVLEPLKNLDFSRNFEEENLWAGKRTLMYVLCYANLSDDKITEKDGFAEVPFF